MIPAPDAAMAPSAGAGTAAPDGGPAPSAPDAAALRAQIARSSFYAAMRLMPRAEREGMFAIYAFCRLVDDVADDGTRPRPARAAELDGWRDDLAALFAGRPPGRAAFLAEATRRFGLREADFRAVVDGMAMDVAADIRAPDEATLDLYCDRVASAVGRLSVRVFGMEEGPGGTLAHHLGRALQMTNILRDLDEDAAIGRLYLPRDLLPPGAACGDPAVMVGDPMVDVACRALAGRALEHFGVADSVLRARPGGRLFAPRLMAAVYRALLEDMLRSGWAPPRRRARIGKGRLLRIIARVAVIG